MINLVLMLSVEQHDARNTYDPEWYSGADVSIGGYLIGHRPYDGSGAEEIQNEVTLALAELLREKLGWQFCPAEGDGVLYFDHLLLTAHF